MNIQEFIQIIKTKKLYRYRAFQIGPPNDKHNIGTFRAYAQAYGIYEKTAGIWNTYIVDDRGGVSSSGKDFTEAGACEWLLSLLQSDKDESKPYEKLFGQSGYHIQNREKWFD